MAAVSKDIVNMIAEHFGNLANRLQATMSGPGKPLLEEAPGPTFVGILPQRTQTLFDGPSPAHLEIQLFQGF